ncbi:MAG: hypothetical protein IPI88_14015 [Chitinophagaceae bacterium]|nr:hypothetical protein [Chitinophagaceae bacterium]
MIQQSIQREENKESVALLNCKNRMMPNTTPVNKNTQNRPAKANKNNYKKPIAKPVQKPRCKIKKNKHKTKSCNAK